MTATMVRGPRGRVDQFGRAWPTQNLVEVSGIKLEDIAELAGFSRRAGTRWAHWETFSDVRADLLACRLGLHPRDVWPDWDDGVLADVDVETRPDPGPGERRAKRCGPVVPITHEVLLPNEAAQILDMPIEDVLELLHAGHIDEARWPGHRARYISHASIRRWREGVAC